MIQKIFFITSVFLALAFQNCSNTKFATQEFSQNEKVKSPTDVPRQIASTNNDDNKSPATTNTNLPSAPTSTTTITTAPATPVATGKFYCLHRGGASDVTQDVYEQFSDGSFTLKERCSDWHSTVKENHGYNCGTVAGYPINGGFASCCPQGSVTVNGRCAPEAGLGEACFADANCKAGLACHGTCQPKF